jgi:protein-disulfide isomerase
MSRSWLRVVPCAAVAIAMMVIAGCGGDDATTPSATGSAVSTGTSVSSSATAASSGQGTQATALNSAIPAGADGKNLGPASAKATLTIYEDFQCPYCLQFNALYEPMLFDYVKAGNLRLEFRNYPILGDESVNAAIAGECVAAQNKFWPFFQRLYTEQLNAGQLFKEQTDIGRFSDANLAKFAADVGADSAKFATCYASADTLAAVQADADAAHTLGLRGTPGVVVNGKPVDIPQTIPDFKAILDAATK